MSEMTTLSEVLRILKDEGYTYDFNLNDNCLVCHGNALKIHPEDFTVDRHYRFEGDTDPGDQAIVYAISSDKHKIKGTLVNGYGLYSDSMSSDMVKALNNSLIDKDMGKSKEMPPEIFLSQTLTLDASIRQLEADTDKTVKTFQLFKNEAIKVMLVALNPAAELKKHTAPGPISVQVIKGSIVFYTNENPQTLVAGQLLVLENGIPHSVYANEMSVFLVTISIQKK